MSQYLRTTLFVVALFVILGAIPSSALGQQASSSDPTLLLQEQIKMLLEKIQGLESKVTTLQGELGATPAKPTTATRDSEAVTRTVKTGEEVAPDMADEDSGSLFNEELFVPDIRRTLSRGSRGDDVRMLQEFLAHDAEVYPEGIASGFFGPSTEAALKRWQKKNGLAQAGIFGLQSRAKLQEFRDAWERKIESEPADMDFPIPDLYSPLTTRNVRRVPGLGKDKREICPTTPSVTSCPKGEKRVLNYVSNACGISYSCKKVSADEEIERPICPTVDPIACSANEERVVDPTAYGVCGPYYTCRPKKEIIPIVGKQKDLAQKSPNGLVTALRVYPDRAPIGTPLKISGSGFTRENNIVVFDNGYKLGVPSPDLSSLSFTVPEDRVPLCAMTDPQCLLPAPYAPVTPGTYKIYVGNSNGWSDSLRFEVIKPEELKDDPYRAKYGDVECSKLGMSLPGCHLMPENSAVRFDGMMKKYIYLGTTDLHECTKEPVTGCSRVESEYHTVMTRQASSTVTTITATSTTTTQPSCLSWQYWNGSTCVARSATEGTSAARAFRGGLYFGQTWFGCMERLGSTADARRLQEFLNAGEFPPPWGSLTSKGQTDTATCEREAGWTGYATSTSTSGRNWAEHTWRFKDGSTQWSNILNRADTEYKDFIRTVDTEALQGYFGGWKSDAGNDSASNWQSFGIPSVVASSTYAVNTTDTWSCSSTLVNLLGQGCHRMNDAYFNGAMDQYVMPGATTVKYCAMASVSGCAPTTTTTTGNTGGSGTATTGGTSTTGTGGTGTSSGSNTTGGSTTTTDCNDGRDNDSDGKVDYPADDGCYGANDTTEYIPNSSGGGSVTSGSSGSGSATSCPSDAAALLGTGCHNMGQAYFNSAMDQYVMPGSSTLKRCTSEYVSGCTSWGSGSGGGSTSSGSSGGSSTGSSSGSGSSSGGSTWSSSNQKEQVWNSLGLRSWIRNDADQSRIDTLKTACANTPSASNVWMSGAGDYASADFGMPDSTKCTAAAACPSGTYYNGSSCGSSSSWSSGSSSNCGSGFYWNGSSCVSNSTGGSSSCSSGQYWNGSVCTASGSGNTSSGSTNCGSGGYYWNGSSCVSSCGSGQYWSGSACVSSSSSGSTSSGDYSAACATAGGTWNSSTNYCQMPNSGSTSGSSSGSSCTSGQYWNGSACVSNTSSSSGSGSSAAAFRQLANIAESLRAILNSLR